MKNIILIILVCLCFNSIQAQPNFFDENDECSNPGVVGGFGPTCTIVSILSTTINATFNNSSDLFSCDNSPLKSSVFFSFNTGVSEVQFDLLQGENINVTLLKNSDGEDICNSESTELTNNCFTGLSADDNPFGADIPDVLFTNLTPMTRYLMAIWTDETEQTDFEVCLTRAPAYECGDGVCYPLAENNANCPQDCPCIAAATGTINCE